MLAKDMERRNESWHLDKRIPIAVLFGFMVQTMSIVWWAAGVGKDIEYLKDGVRLLLKDIYTSADAARDNANQLARMESMSRRLDDHETRMRLLEGRNR